MRTKKPTPYQRVVLEQLARPGRLTTRWSDGDYFIRPDGVSTRIHPAAMTTMIRERWVEITPFAMLQNSYVITREGRRLIGVLSAPSPRAAGEGAVSEGE